MELKKGTKFYRLNKKTNNIETISIIDEQYVFDRKIGSKSNFTREEIDDLVEEGIIKEDVSDILEDAIKKIESQFKVKLKVVGNNEN